MHETGIALEVFRSALKSAHQKTLTDVRLIRVKVSIGDRAAVEPDLLNQAWQSVVMGTRHDGALLQVNWCQSRRYCSSCKTEKQSILGSWLPICPDCGDAIIIEGGQELDLDSVEFEPFASPPKNRPASGWAEPKSHV